jgi:small-conductance mechanosensitive channel
VSQVLLGNSVQAWLTAGAIFAAVFLVLFAFRHLVARRLEQLASRTATIYDDAVVDLLKRTRLYFMLALALRAASVPLDVPEKFATVVRGFVWLAVLFQSARWGNGLINFWLTQWARRTGEVPTAGAIYAFGILARSALWIVIILLALDNALGVDITTLVAGLGITGVAVALAVQNILGDLFAALSIILDKPFVVGDVVAVDTFVGTVEHIGLKTTRIRSISGEQVIFSNADLLKSRVRNLRNMSERRVQLMVGVEYSTPPEKLRQIPNIMRQVAGDVANVRLDRAHFVGFGESALTCEAVYFITNPDYLTFMDAQQAINLALIDRFAAEGIRFAFPTRNVILSDQKGEGNGEKGERLPSLSDATRSAPLPP